MRPTVVAVEGGVPVRFSTAMLPPEEAVNVPHVPVPETMFWHEYWTPVVVTCWFAAPCEHDPDGALETLTTPP
jgi:hypothetical protein